MKNFKKLLLGVFLLAIVFITSGCGNKTALTAENFKSKVEAKGYTVQDATSQFSSNSEISKVYIAIASDSSYQIEFYVLDSTDNAVSFYNNNKSIFEQSKSNGSGETNSEIGNHSKYTLKTNGTYKVISRIDNTVVYLNVNSTYKKNIDKILKELGY